MKKAVFWALTALLVVISCGKGEDNVTPPTDLVGSWQLESLVSDGQPKVLNDCERQWKQEFQENNTLTYHYSEVQDDGSCKSEVRTYTYQVSGNQITFSSEMGKQVSTFFVKDNKLTLITPASQSRSGKEETAIYTKVTASSNTAEDLIIGNWRIRVIQDASGTAEVTNLPCVKDTNMKIDQTTALFTLYLPNPKTKECGSGQELYKWSKQGDTYYYEVNGQKQMFPIELRDNNQTLMLDYHTQSGNFKFYFTRN